MSIIYLHTSIVKNLAKVKIIPIQFSIDYTRDIHISVPLSSLRVRCFIHSPGDVTVTGGLFLWYISSQPTAGEYHE